MTLECNKFSSQFVLKLDSQLDSQVLKLDLYSSVRSSVPSSIRSSIRSSVCSLICSSIHSSIRSSVHSSIRFYCANPQISYKPRPASLTHFGETKRNKLGVESWRMKKTPPFCNCSKYTSLGNKSQLNTEDTYTQTNMKR